MNKKYLRKKIGKKGMELSINFIVVLILAVVTLSLAIVLTYNIFSKATTMKEDIDDQTRANIVSLLDSGEQVAIPVNRLKIEGGSSDVFGVGVLNTESIDTSFYLDIKIDKPSIGVFDSEGKAPSTAEVNAAKKIIVDQKGIEIIYVTKSTKPISIGPGKHEVLLVGARVSKNVPKYLYTYTVNVKKATTNTQYGLPQKIYIEVK